MQLELVASWTYSTRDVSLYLNCHGNNNNNNIVNCKAHKVSSNAESEAPAVARWAALVGCAKRTVLRRRLKVSAGESLVSRLKR